MVQNKASGLYDALNPWADVDPKPLRGISPRIDNLAGKKIGLFRNDKRGALPIEKVIAERLKARYPSIELSEFLRLGNVSVAETPLMGKFEEWLKGLDAVICAYGD